MNDKSDDSSMSMTVDDEEQESVQSITISNSKKRGQKHIIKKRWTLDKEFSSGQQAVNNNGRQACCTACLRNFSIGEEKLVEKTAYE